MINNKWLFIVLVAVVVPVLAKEDNAKEDSKKGESFGQVYNLAGGPCVEIAAFLQSMKPALVGQPMLHRAAIDGNVRCVAELLQNVGKIDPVTGDPIGVNAKGRNEGTALDFIRPTYRKDLDRMRGPDMQEAEYLLLKNGALTASDCSILDRGRDRESMKNTPQ